MESPPTVRELLELIEELVGVFDGEIPDYSECPYRLQDGTEGAYGPNTCGYGCSQEPACVEGPWPLERARDVLRQHLQDEATT